MPVLIVVDTQHLNSLGVLSPVVLCRGVSLETASSFQFILVLLFVHAFGLRQPDKAPWEEDRFE